MRDGRYDWGQSLGLCAWLVLRTPHTPAAERSSPRIGCLVSKTWDCETLSVAEYSSHQLEELNNRAEMPLAASLLHAGIIMYRKRLKRSSKEQQQAGGFRETGQLQLHLHLQGERASDFGRVYA